MNKLILTALILLSGVAVADENRQLVEAEADYAVGNAAAAFARYQVLLPQSRPAWQRAILMYNMAVAQAEQGQFTEAITLLKAVPLDQSPHPLLAEHVTRLIVWSYWQQGLKQMKEHRYSQATAALHDALAAIPAAEQAHCALLYAQGITHCEPTYEEWRRRIEQALEESAKQPPTPETREVTPVPQQAQREEKKTQVLQTVLQMEQEDAMPQKSQPLRTTEQRPW